MDALDVISLEDAKSYLVVDFNDLAVNKEIERAINAAVAWVEEYTDYRLYQRDEVIISTGYETSIYQYPLTLGLVKDKDDNTLTVNVKYGTLRQIVCCPPQSTINLAVGYTTADDIPGPLLSAAYKLLTYLFENKDAYTTGLPLDVQVLINKFRRSPAI